MSNTDAERSERTRAAARERWRQAGDPVLTRSVAVVVERQADLDAGQLAQLAAITGSPADGDDAT